MGVTLKVTDNAIPDAEAEEWEVVVVGLRQHDNDDSLDAGALPLAQTLDVNKCVQKDRYRFATAHVFALH